jgi:hypothetical protein
MTRIPTNISDLVGRTPIVQLTRMAPDRDVGLEEIHRQLLE